MDTAILDAPAVKKARRRVSQATSRPVKHKVGVYLSAESYRRLGVYSHLTGDDWSTVIDRLVREHLRRFVIRDLEKPDGPATQEVSASPDE